jgi:hypothetical protein
MGDFDEIEALLAQEDETPDEKSFFEFADLNKVITDLTKDMKKNAADLKGSNTRKSAVDKKLLVSLDGVLRFNENLNRKRK